MFDGLPLKKLSIEIQSVFQKLLHTGSIMLNLEIETIQWVEDKNKLNPLERERICQFQFIRKYNRHKCFVERREGIIRLNDRIVLHHPHLLNHWSDTPSWT